MSLGFSGRVSIISVGDANLDGVFDSSDLVQMFQAGEYENDVAGDSVWADGDFNGDGEFDSSDLVLAFQAGTYVVPGVSPAITFAAVESIFAANEELLGRKIGAA